LTRRVKRVIRDQEVEIMAKLTERIDDTRTHLARESSVLVSRTRRAGNGLARALKQEADEWRGYFETGRSTIEKEIAALTAPSGIERATLRLADRALAQAHATVHARLGRLERELSRATASKKKTKARPSAKATRASRPPSRRLVNAPSEPQAA
jgi:hypothetical protein